MKANKIREVKKDHDGNVTVIHSNGSFHYNENEVVLKEWTNSFFCRFKIDEQTSWQRFIFWNWVLSIFFGLFFLVIGMELSQIPLEKRRVPEFAEFFIIGVNNWFYIPLLFLFTYIGLRWIYFLRYRDFFSKDLVFISLKSNQQILLKGERKRTFSLLYETYALQKILTGTKNIRVFEKKETKANNSLKLIWEYIIAIFIFFIASYFIFSSWGENRLTDPIPLGQLYKADSKMEFEKWETDIKKWEIKHDKEQIYPHYFFSLGYIVPVILGLVVLTFSLFSLLIFSLFILPGLIQIIISLISVYYFATYPFYYFGFGQKKPIMNIVKLTFHFGKILYGFVLAIAIGLCNLITFGILEKYLLKLYPSKDWFDIGRILKLISVDPSDGDDVMLIVSTVSFVPFIFLSMLMKPIGYTEFIWEQVYIPINKLIEPLMQTAEILDGGIGISKNLIQFDYMIFIFVFSLIPYLLSCLLIFILAYRKKKVS